MPIPYRNEKLAKIRASLASAPRGEEAYVFRLFTEKVQLLLRWLERVPESDSDRVVLKMLDDLALYMRFLESAIHQTLIPYAMIEHTTELSERIDPDAVVLLRPQNHQTFDTRPNSVNTMLLGLAKRLVSPSSGYEGLKAQLTATPDVYVVSYPKYLGDVFLTFPILGHEFGHILWQNYAVKPATEYLLKSYPTADASARAKRQLASSWAMEIFCDRVGMHLYGLPYLFALRFVLSPYPTRLAVPSFSTVVNTLDAGVTGLIADVVRELREKLAAGEAWQVAVEFASVRLIEGFNDGSNLRSTAVEREASPTDGLTHPSPGRRFKQLLAVGRDQRPHYDATGTAEDGVSIDSKAGNCASSTRIPISARFEKWVDGLSSEYGAFDEQFGDQEYEAVLQVATNAAEVAYTAISTRLGPPYSGIAREPSLRHLYERLQRWVPPCEVPGQPKPIPAEWEDIIHAGWIRWIEVFECNADEGDEADAYVRTHMDEYLRFVQESMDMNNLYRTYSLIAGLTG